MPASRARVTTLFAALAAAVILPTAGGAAPAGAAGPGRAAAAAGEAAHGHPPFRHAVPSSSNRQHRAHSISTDGASGMDLTDAWSLTKGDSSVIIAYIEGGINWHGGNAKSLMPNIYVNWHALPVPCSGSSVASATMVVGGVSQSCATQYSGNASDYDTDHDGVINALDWSNDPRVNPNADGTGFINPEDLIAAFSQPPYQANADGGPYPYDISGWDFYDNQNDPATTDSTYGHSDGMMGYLQHECPQCMILPIKAGEEALDSTDRLAEAWLFAAEQGARVIVSVTADIGYSPFMAQVVNYLQSKGIVMVESSNDFDSSDHQGGMFWPYVIPGNGAVANSAGTAWTRSDLTSWGSKSVFTVATGGGSTSESTPTTGGVLGLLLSYGDLAYADKIIGSPLTGPEAVQVMRATATAITDPALPWPGGPGEWNPQYGYGMPQVYNAMLAVKGGAIPPTPAITAPGWYTPIDPTTASQVPVSGTVSAFGGGSFTWQLQYGLGGNPSSWTTFGTGSGSGSFSGTLGTLDLSQIPQSFWSAAFSLSTTKEVETVDQYTVTLRVVVTDANNNVGEDRRAIAVFHDPTLLPGFPMNIASSGESQPALVDLQGNGTLDIVFATSGGSVEALDPATGQELPGWPAHTDPLAPLGVPSSITPGDEPVVAPVAVGDLLHTGNLDVVVTSIDGRVYAFDNHGNLLSGWPRTLNTGVTAPPIPRPADPMTRFPVQGDTAAPVLTHLSGGPDLQVVQAGMDGYLHAYRPDGSDVTGWPVKVALPASFAMPPSGWSVIDDQTLPTSPAVADLQLPGVPDIVERSQYTQFQGGGISTAAKALVFAFQPDGQPVAGWPVAMPGLSEYYGSAMGPITEGTDAPVAGPVTSLPSSQGTVDDVVTNPVFTPAFLLSGNGQTVNLYNGGTELPFTSTGALGLFGGQMTFAQSGVDVASLAEAEGSPNTGTAIAKEEVAFGADAGGSFLPHFPTSMQGLDFLGGPDIADVSGGGQNSILEGGDSSAVQAYRPDGTQAPGFPKFTSGWIIGAPSIGDLFSKGSNDVVATTREGYLFAWSTPGSSSSIGEWTGWRHDTWNSANFSTDAASPGVARAVTWTPDATTLTFEAPGGDWYRGTVAHYDIALAPSGQLLEVPASGSAGSTQTVSIPAGTTGLTIQSVNAAGNLGEAVSIGAAPPPASPQGFWAATAGGLVDAAGGATFHGSPAASGLSLKAPIVAMAPTPDGNGYWLVASDGGVFTFGDAGYFGSTGSLVLNKPIVGMAATPDGNGYWLVAADGGIFTFGDAHFFGSAPGGALGAGSSPGALGNPGGSQAFVSMAATPDGGGYWLLTSSGYVDAYGDAIFAGSAAQGGTPQPAAALIPTRDGAGYWILHADGEVVAFGDATPTGTVNVNSGDVAVGGAR